MTMASPEKNAVCQEIENNLKAMLMLTPSPPHDQPSSTNQHQSSIPRNTKQGFAGHHRTYGHSGHRWEQRQGTSLSHNKDRDCQEDRSALGVETSRDRGGFYGRSSQSRWQGSSKRENRKWDPSEDPVRNEMRQFRVSDNADSSEKISSMIAAPLPQKFRNAEKRYNKDHKNNRLQGSSQSNKHKGMHDPPPRFDKKKDAIPTADRSSELVIVTEKEESAVTSTSNNSSHSSKNDSAKQQRRRTRKAGNRWLNGEIVADNLSSKFTRDFIVPASQQTERKDLVDLSNCIKQQDQETISVMVTEKQDLSPLSDLRNSTDNVEIFNCLVDNLSKKTKREKQKDEKRKSKVNKRDKQNNVQVVKEGKSELKSAGPNNILESQSTIVPPQRKQKAGKKIESKRSSQSESSETPMPLYDAVVLNFLKEEYIHPLKKKSTRFPRAHFFCRLCDYHCDDIENVSKHVSHQSHIMRKQLRQAEVLLRKIPSPAQPHVDALSHLMEKVAMENGLSPEDVARRNAVVDELNAIFSEKLPGCQVRLFGSSVNGFGLKTSDVNIDLIVPAKQELAKSLAAAFEHVKDCGKYADVQCDFGAKIPYFSFVDKKRDLYCEVSLNNSPSQQTTQLLAEYSKYDPRVRCLGLIFRYWAKLCHIDQQKKGTMPAHSFPLMTVYFLQQCSPPVLPVFREERKFKCKNKMSVGELWLGLLKFYSIGYPCDEYVVCIRVKKLLRRSEKNWNNKLMAIEDPFLPKRNIVRSVSHLQVFRFIQERLCSAYLYFGVPQLTVGPLFTADEISTFPNADDRWTLKRQPKETSKSQTPPGVEVTNNEEGADKAHEIEVGAEDTFKQLQTSSDSEDEGIPAVLPSINLSIKDTPPQHMNTTESEDDECLKLMRDRHLSDTFDADSSSISDLDDLLADHDPDTPIDQVISVLANMKLDDISANDELRELHAMALCEIKTAGSNESKDSGDEASPDKTVCCDTKLSPPPCEYPSLLELLKSSKLPLHIQERISSVKQHELAYEFSESKASGGKKPPLLCQLCMKDGHLKQDCPDEKLPELVPLPEMTPAFLRQLDRVCGQIMRQCSPTPREEEERESVLREVEKYIQELYPDARLQLFGSSCNGFGFSRSDMDICLTFDGNKTGEGIKQSAIIEALAEKLRMHPSLHNVIPITTAKVPIVKFSKGRLDGDISLYNTLAEHNTRMLRTYSQIDHRVKILGYTLKYFAKVCDIGDASRGSLSSYAYILMVLHFLQQAKPPVIPVLQELYDSSEPRPEVIVDGWNAWFYDDNQNLPIVWPEDGSNSNSVGKLWLEMLRYYTEEFQFSNHVVTIRTKGPLTRFEKLWNSKSIAIEDPFDHSHNLGAGVSRKMNTYIMKAFIRGRELFGTPVARNVIDSDNLLEFLFDREFLTDGSPPNDRGCRACGKIGHKVKECPRRRASREVRHERQQWAEARKQAAKCAAPVAPTQAAKAKGVKNSPNQQDRLPVHPKQVSPNLPVYFQCPRMKTPVVPERPLHAFTLHCDQPRMACHLPKSSHLEPEKPLVPSVNLSVTLGSPPKTHSSEQTTIYPRMPAPPGFAPVSLPVHPVLHGPLVGTPPSRVVPPFLTGSPPYKMQCIQPRQFASQFQTPPSQLRFQVQMQSKMIQPGTSPGYSLPSTLPAFHSPVGTVISQDSVMTEDKQSSATSSEIHTDSSRPYSVSHLQASFTTNPNVHIPPSMFLTVGSSGDEVQIQSNQHQHHQ